MKFEIVQFMVITAGLLAFLAFLFTHSWLHLIATGIGFGYCYGLAVRSFFK